MKRASVYFWFLVLLAVLVSCAPRVQGVVEEAFSEVDVLGPVFFCGYRRGATLPHRIFAPTASGSVRLGLLGGESAAVGLMEGFFPADDPTDVAELIPYPGNLDGCLLPPLFVSFRPGGAFGLVHVFGRERSRVYTLDERNQEPRGFRAYEAFTLEGKPAGVLLFVEEWVDADYNDAVLLLQGAEPVR